ncbi:hypothetical protein QQF64_005403 [Cirrhinus molitorella]|uniref:Small nuclear RNA activating complex polypeptide 1 n=1 Tax=Cirrhinus molitorella TaxID=172907 RepID=A0ABR3MFA3_9TELE
MDNFREPVKTDCEELLGRFRATESVRYEQFVEIWRDMDFSSIFHGKPELNDRRHFARLILSVVTPYFLPPYTFQIRVGGLYLLYGLFNTQLTTPREKLNFRIKREDGKRKKVCEEFVDPPSRPQELVTTDVLEEIANIHEHYEDLKKAIFTEPDPNLDIVQQNLVPKLNSTVLSFCNWQINRVTSEQQDAGEGPSNQESSSRARLLASIKSKSYGQAVEASKSRRHRQTELVPATGPDISQNVSSKKKRFPSLKTRTQLRFKTQGSESEVSNLTRLWCLTAVNEEKEPEKKKKKFNWNPDEQ